MKKILFVTSEAIPFAKSGGLGDMVSSLAIALKKLSYDVRIVMPRYYRIDKTSLRQHQESLAIPLGWGQEWTGVYEGRLPQSEVPVYFLDHEGYFGRDGIYGPHSAASYDDNFARFTLLSRGAFQLCKMLHWIPDFMHSHDWPSALVSVYLRTWEKEGVFAGTKSIFTIHNLGYQGWFHASELFHAQLTEKDFLEQGLEALGGINLMKAGITTSDYITTVSPTYAKEIQTGEYGEGLDGLLRYRKEQLEGILNGIDMESWNPETDIYLKPHNYSITDLTSKAIIKAEIQKELGLPQENNQPLIAIISRLVSQKGIELLIGEHGVLSRLSYHHPKAQMIILGTGEAWLEHALLEWSYKHPNIKVRILFDEAFSHRLEAAADFFLMPSRYEPCGLNQLYSLRYGTLPIVRHTGGLADSVMHYDESSGEGTGFVFNHYNADGCWWALNYAIESYYQRPEHISKMRKNAMQANFGWEQSAKAYAQLYSRL